MRSQLACGFRLRVQSSRWVHKPTCSRPGTPTLNQTLDGKRSEPTYTAVSAVESKSPGTAKITAFHMTRLNTCQSMADAWRCTSSFGCIAEVGRQARWPQVTATHRLKYEDWKEDMQHKMRVDVHSKVGTLRECLSVTLRLRLPRVIARAIIICAQKRSVSRAKLNCIPKEHISTCKTHHTSQLGFLLLGCPSTQIWENIVVMTPDMTPNIKISTVYGIGTCIK